MKAYKILGRSRMPCHGGEGRWPEPGEWREVEGPLVPCRHGLHLCRRDDLIEWLGPTIWTVEYDDAEVVVGAGKLVVRRARLLRQVRTWDAKTQRRFAAAVTAAVVLPAFEKKYPGDSRPRDTIEAARKYTRGEITRRELGAVRAAAWETAWETARVPTPGVQAAAWAAAWTVEKAAWRAALCTAQAAAWAADEPQRAVVRARQTEILFSYLGHTRT